MAVIPVLSAVPILEVRLTGLVCTLASPGAWLGIEIAGAIAATAALRALGAELAGASSGLLMLLISTPNNAPSALSFGFGLDSGAFSFSFSIFRRFCSISAAAVMLVVPKTDEATILGDNGDGDFLRVLPVMDGLEISGDLRRFRGLDGFRNLLASIALVEFAMSSDGVVDERAWGAAVVAVVCGKAGRSAVVVSAMKMYGRE